MRYSEIAERKQQRTEIMYHGTSSNLVPSILKNGLLAAPPKKTYDIDTYGASTASMGGVYVTPSREYAEEISRESAETHGGKPAMVTIQYVRGSADLDEDDIVAAISQAASDVMRRLSQKAPAQAATRDFDTQQTAQPDPLSQYSSLSYPQEGWATDRMIRNKKAYAVEIAKQSIQQLSKKSKPRRTAYDLIVQIAAGLLDQAAQESDVRERWNMIRFGAYDVVRQNMEEPLGQLMRQISPDVAGQDSEAPRRINRDVKFSGKTKIVKIEVGDQVIYPRGQRNEIQ
jgi:hypothetical protein